MDNARRSPAANWEAPRLQRLQLLDESGLGYSEPPPPGQDPEEIDPELLKELEKANKSEPYDWL